MKEREEKLICKRFLWFTWTNYKFFMYLIRTKTMKPLLQQRNLQFLNLIVRLIMGLTIYLMHHLVFLFPWVSLLSFPHAPQNLPRCSLSPVPSPLPPGAPKVFTITINLSCTKMGGVEGGKITQERSVLNFTWFPIICFLINFLFARPLSDILCL